MAFDENDVELVGEAVVLFFKILFYHALVRTRPCTLNNQVAISFLFSSFSSFLLASIFVCSCSFIGDVALFIYDL